MTPAAVLRQLARPDHPDGHLLAAFAADRDEAAFAELVRRHGPLVWATCRRILANPVDADDAFQASFLVLVRRAHRLTSAGTVGPWLHRVAVLTARDLRKKAARRSARLCPLPPDLPAPPVPPSDVDDLLLGLPDRYRAAVVLCCLEGLTQRAAAERLGVPEGTLSARLSRGLAKLRARYAGTLPMAAGVPVVLSGAVVQAATSLHLAAAVSPGVIQLTEGVLRMFLLKKAAAAVGCVLAVGLALGVGTRFGPAAADEPKPPADPVATATAELDRRIEQYRQMLELNRQRRKVSDDDYARKLQQQEEELKRLEAARRSLTGRPAVTALEATTVYLAVQTGGLRVPYTVYETNDRGVPHYVAEIYTDSFLVRHLRRLRAEPKCPTTITLSISKDAPPERTQVALDAIKAAGFQYVRPTEAAIVTPPAARQREDKRQTLAARVADRRAWLERIERVAEVGVMSKEQVAIAKAELDAALRELAELTEDRPPVPVAPDGQKVLPPRLKLAPLELAVNERAEIVVPGQPLKGIVSGHDTKATGVTGGAADAHFVADKKAVRVTGRKPGVMTLVVAAEDGTQAEVSVTVVE